MNLRQLSHKRALKELLAKVNLKALAQETGWQKRKPKKLSASKFLEILMSSVWRSDGRLCLWSWEVGVKSNRTISIAGMHRRINQSAIDWVKALWAKALETQSRRDCPELFKSNRFKGRVLIEDSSCINLPNELCERYQGGNNGHAKIYSQARLNLVYELTRGQLLKMDFKSYRCNDQSMSPEILSEVNRGDLVIRDLGYAVGDVWNKLIAKGVDFLSRCPHLHHLYIEHQGKQSDLLKLLRNKSIVDIEVSVMRKCRVPVRLVAIKAPDKVAAERRRKAREGSDTRANRSKKYMKLLGWSIFLTTLDKQSWPPKDLLKLYGVRWRIEMFFKACKQHLKLTHWSPLASPVAIELVLQARLLAMLLVSEIYSKCCWLLQDTQLSLLKFFEWTLREWESLSLIPSSKKFLSLIGYHASYQKRSRSNFIDLFEALC